MIDHNILTRQVFKILIIIGSIFISNSAMNAQEEIQDAKVTVSFSEEEGDKIITATALDQQGEPIEDLELYFYVQRTFSLLPIGDIFNATDENGRVQIEFPADLPADPSGNVLLVVKILESDVYNDLTLEITKKWGIPALLEDSSNEKRALWAAAANAPITLIILVSGIILAIWFIIFYILFYLYKISKIKTLNT